MWLCCSCLIPSWSCGEPLASKILCKHFYLHPTSSSSSSFLSSKIQDVVQTFLFTSSILVLVLQDPRFFANISIYIQHPCPHPRPCPLASKISIYTQHPHPLQLNLGIMMHNCVHDGLIWSQRAAVLMTHHVSIGQVLFIDIKSESH